MVLNNLFRLEMHLMVTFSAYIPNLAIVARVINTQLVPSPSVDVDLEALKKELTPIFDVISESWIVFAVPPDLQTQASLHSISATLSHLFFIKLTIFMLLQLNIVTHHFLYDKRLVPDNKYWADIIQMIFNENLELNLQFWQQLELIDESINEILVCVL
jgi:hypothetical protein